MRAGSLSSRLEGARIQGREMFPVKEVNRFKRARLAWRNQDASATDAT